MATHKLILFFILSAFYYAGKAQDGSDPERNNIYFTDFSVQYGIYPVQHPNATLDDFKALAPESEMLNKDFSSYSQSGGFSFLYSYGRTLNMFAIHGGFQIPVEPHLPVVKNRHLRMGLIHYSGTLFNTYLFASREITFDTVISPVSGYIVYYDSLFRSDYSMTYSVQQLLLDIAIINQIGGQGLFSVFFGAGINSGVSLNSYTNIVYHEYKSVTSSSNNSVLWDETNNNTESMGNKPSYGMFFFVPMGIDFRFARKHEFWRRLHIFYEADAGIQLMFIPELRTFLSAGIKHGFGIRITDF